MGNENGNDEGPGAQCSMLVAGIVNFKSDLVMFVFFIHFLFNFSQSL